jgi:probable HAF family extracellular repeat protein
LRKILALGLLVLSSTANAVTYNITQLQSLSGEGTSLAYALNENGTVVGKSYNSVSGVQEAVVWNNGIVQSLGVEGLARGVNNNGQVVGQTGSISLGFPNGQAFVWSASDGYSELGTLGGSYAGAYDINESGVITGHSWIAANNAVGSTHAFKYEDGTMTDLGTVTDPLGYSRGHGINDAGEVAGRASAILFTGSDKHQATWDANGTINAQVDSIYSYSTGEQINNNGIVVGNANVTAEGQFRGAIWDANGVATYIDTLGGNRSHLYGVNDSDEIVGYARNADGKAQAIVADTDGNITDLNTLVVDMTGWQSLATAYDINEAGQIVGYGTLENGDFGAFLLSPVTVPVPAAIWLFGTALGMLGWMRRRNTLRKLSGYLTPD